MNLDDLASYGGLGPLKEDIYFVYILKCANDSYFVGCTKDLNDRLNRHNKGYIKSTKLRLPVQIVHLSVFPDRVKAFQFEKYLKSGSGKAFMNKRFI